MYFFWTFLLWLVYQEAAEQLQEKVVAAIKEVDTKLNFEDIAKLEDNERNHLLNLYRETMLKGYNFGFDVRLVQSSPFHVSTTAVANQST